MSDTGLLFLHFVSSASHYTNLLLITTGRRHGKVATGINFDNIERNDGINWLFKSGYRTDEYPLVGEA